MKGVVWEHTFWKLLGARHISLPCKNTLLLLPYVGAQIRFQSTDASPEETAASSIVVPSRYYKSRRRSDLYRRTAENIRDEASDGSSLPTKAPLSNLDLSLVPQGSCVTVSDEPVTSPNLTPLQRRQKILNLNGKKVFVLTERAVKRFKYLLNEQNSMVRQRLKVKSKNDSLIGVADKMKGKQKTLFDSHNNKIAVGIHISIQRKGCSGFGYTINYEFDESKITGEQSHAADEVVKFFLEEHNDTDGSSSTTAVAAELAKTKKCQMFNRGRKPTSNVIDNSEKEADIHVEQGGIHIFVDSTAFFYVVGTTVDYSISNTEEKFTFLNPNQKAVCGCGESFMPFDI